MESELFNIAAAIPLQCLTCHYLCCDIISLSKKNIFNILVHAGAGGCGGIIIQILKNIFNISNIITTVGNQDKLKLALSNGADHGIIYTLAKYTNNSDNLKNDILNCCIEKKKCSIIFDGVGLATWNLSLQCCQTRGTVVYFGNASGKVPPINPLALTKQGSVMITRPTLKDFVVTKKELNYRINDIFNWIEKGLLNIHIGCKLPLYQAVKAHQLLEARKTTGKILLIP